VSRRGVWLELVLSWVLGLDSLVDLLDLVHQQCQSKEDKTTHDIHVLSRRRHQEDRSLDPLSVKLLGEAGD
jgi:hypothetical protein